MHCNSRLTQFSWHTKRVPASAIYWIGLAVLAVFLNSAHVFNSDEGLILEGAWGLLHGRELYSQSFQFVAPGSFYFIAWLWRVFGPDYAVAKLASAICILLTSAAIFQTESILSEKKNVLSYAGPLLYCMASVFYPTINHNTFNALFMAWAAYFLVRAESSKSLSGVAISGLLSGVALLFLQHKGLMFAATVLLFFAVVYGRNDRNFWLKATLLYLLFLCVPLTLLLHWPTPLLFEDLIEFPRLHYVEVNRVSIVPLVITVFYVILLFVALRGRIAHGILLLFSLQAVLLLTTLQRTDFAHILILLFPALALAPLALPQIRKITRNSKFCRYCYVGAGIFACVFITASAGDVAFSLAYRYVSGGNQGTSVIELINRSCKTFYAGPFMPGLYFEARTINPISYSMLLTGLNTERQYAIARAELEVSAPDCAVVNYEMVKKFNYDQKNPLDDFIKANYRLRYVVDDIRIFEKKSLATLGEDRPE